jgi:phospholipase/carboxylesterase
MAMLQTIERHPADPPRATIIVLHGLGADGTGFLPIADEIDLAAVGRVRWVVPRAPIRPMTINNGMRTRAWYDLSTPDLARREDEAPTAWARPSRTSQPPPARGRGGPARVVRVGALAARARTRARHAGAAHRARRLLAGLRHHARRRAALSRAPGGPAGHERLPAASRYPRSRASCGQRRDADVPAHGTQDAIAAAARGRAGRDRLAALGQPVQWLEYPMEHSVCLEEVQALERWLREVLAG